MFLNVVNNKSELEYTQQRLESCLQAAWDTLDKSLFNILGISMLARIEAYIAANGWYTKY
jgi:hypothetical protein